MFIDTDGMSVDPPLTVAPAQLSPSDAATYAEWFGCLADPTRVRLQSAPEAFHVRPPRAVPTPQPVVEEPEP